MRPAPSPRGSRRPTCWCTPATIPRAICSKAPRTQPSSAASPRRPPRSGAIPISSCSTPPIRGGRARGRWPHALARIVRARAINPRFIAGPDAARPARRGRARRDGGPADRFRRDDRRGVERAARSRARRLSGRSARCATSCCAKIRRPRAPSPSASTRRAGSACGIRAATTSTRSLCGAAGGGRGMNAPDHPCAAAPARGCRRRWRPATACWPG